jgi:hypothetical protein
VDEEFNTSAHRYCLLHLCRNLKVSSGLTEAQRGDVFAMAKATTKTAFSALAATFASVNQGTFFLPYSLLLN